MRSWLTVLQPIKLGAKPATEYRDCGVLGPRSTQPCIPLGSLNRVPGLIGWGPCHMGSHSVTCHRAEMTFPPLLQPGVISAGWQVTLCDPIWHASCRSGAVLVAQTAIRFFSLPLSNFYSKDECNYFVTLVYQAIPVSLRTPPHSRINIRFAAIAARISITDINNAVNVHIKTAA